MSESVMEAALQPQRAPASARHDAAVLLPVSEREKASADC